MDLTITRCRIDGVYKAIVIDRARSYALDRIVYIAESMDAKEAFLEATEFVNSAKRSSPEQTWC